MNQVVSWKARGTCGATCMTVLAILAVLQTVHCTTWVVYGLLEQRAILVLPNLTGLLLGLIQVAVCVFSRSLSAETERQGESPRAAPAAVSAVKVPPSDDECRSPLTPLTSMRKRVQRMRSLSSSPSTKACSGSDEPFSPTVPSESSDTHSPLPLDAPQLDLGPQTVDFRGMVRCNSGLVRCNSSLSMRRERDESVRWVGER